MRRRCGDFPPTIAGGYTGLTTRAAEPESTAFSVIHLPEIGGARAKLGANKHSIEVRGEAYGASCHQGYRFDPFEPAAAAIDRGHLARMTLGDRKLERDLLRLFAQQGELLVARMRECEPAGVATLAHTLKGSAMGVGATNVARAAAATELACKADAAECAHAVEQLALAVEEARDAIATLAH